MEFGKVSSTQQLNYKSWNLPLINPRSKNDLKKEKNNEKVSFYIGCPVWAKKEWVGKLYPERTAQKDFLKFYSIQLNSIELNSTFYQIPSITNVHQWVKSVSPDFKFCPKFFQEISRFEVLKSIPLLTESFCNSILEFGNHLGISFLQLPPHFSSSYILILKRFFKLLPKKFELAVEFRHPSWFVNGQLIDIAYDLLFENGISVVITDVAGRRDVLHQSITNSQVMVRFIGNNLHPSDYERLEKWIERIEDLIEIGTKNFYFFIHQPNEEGCIELIDKLINDLNRKFNFDIKNIDFSIIRPQIDLF